MPYNITEIKTFIENLNLDISVLVNRLKKYPQYLQSIKENTNYLKENVSLSQRLFHIAKDLSESPKCKCCENLVKFNGFNKGYGTYCSTKCVGLDKENKQKGRKTRLDQYGYYFNNRQKAEKTFVEKYGYKNNFGKKEILQKAVLSLSSEETKQKRINTNLKNSGYSNNFQSPTTKETLRSRYGVENVMHIEKFANKSRANSSNKMKLRSYSSIFGEILYQTVPELKLIKFCEENKIEIKNGPAIEYELENKKHIYYVDFETKNYLIEIKGKHIWYENDLVSGKLEAKNESAKNYCRSTNKEFLFILDDLDFVKYLGVI